MSNKQVLNTVNLDPTRTISLRRGLTNIFHKYFNTINQITYSLVKERSPTWRYLPSLTKMRDLHHYLDHYIDYYKPTDEVNRYVPYAFKQGISSAFASASRLGQRGSIKSPSGTVLGGMYKPDSPELFNVPSLSVPRPIDQFIWHSMNIESDTLDLLRARFQEEVKGLIAEFSRRLYRGLLEVISIHKQLYDDPQTLNSNDLTHFLNLVLDPEFKFAQNRSALIVQTEIVRIYTEGQLVGYEHSGIENVNTIPELSSYSTLCNNCMATSRKAFRVQDAKGKLPIHPGCKCAWKGIV